ncbi:MAG: hypothetical protein B7Z02_13460 [Rhodobacterales bacterium 32-67-9]|nr:MAG: hypothetical protein B7Z02_13460 [Rhodobacterales bacterium 32-67-9]
MSDEYGTSDFIGRIRQRQPERAAEPPRRKPAVRRSFVVSITRDGKATEDLVFDRAPTIGEIAVRAGTGAYILSIDLIKHPAEAQLAAE